MSLAVRTAGRGPRLVLVHGGLGPELAWERQEPLVERFELVIPWRRGYGESPAVEMQDFELDAADVVELLGERAHLVGFSYGGLGAVLAAAREPERVLSLTLIEPALPGLARDEPEVRETVRQSARIFAAEGPEARTAYAAFAGVEDPGDPDTARRLDQALAAVSSTRPPFQADPDLRAIAAAPYPVLLVSGSGRPGFVRMCDLIAERVGGERLTIEGAGHAVQRAPGFNEKLEEFLLRAAEAPAERR